MLNRISLKTPPPRVVLLPDALFFLRAIPIAEGATAADVAGQAELALESLAPFPLAQMFYAHHWRTGAQHALVYACYRKRFTTDQTDAWNEAEVVMPGFAALLTAKVEPSTTIVVTSEDGITLLHWGDRTDVPSAVASRIWPPESDAAERRKIRDELVRQIGGTRNVFDLSGLPEVQREASVADFVFTLGPIVAHFSREELDALDVRDKQQLNHLRSERRRDVMLWRLFVASLIGLGVATLLEVGLVGGKFWLQSREHLIAQQAPIVEQIMNAQTLAVKIEDLSTKRLLPLEMVSRASTKKPGSIRFVRVTTTDLYSIDIEATTMRPQDITSYQAALRQMPDLSRAEVQNQVLSNGVATFHLVLTFKPDLLKASTT